MRARLIEETLSCLEKDRGNPAKYYLANPHLLYISDQQAREYLRLMKKSQYSKGFHIPTVVTIEKNTEKLFGGFQSGVSFIDFGPGYPDKVLPIARFFQHKNWVFDYYPVDVNQTFLDVAVQAMRPLAHQVVSTHALFEECSNKIPKQAYDLPIICCIGLTFMNFKPEFILGLLKNVAGANGSVMIASELVTLEKTPQKIIEQYNNKEAAQFAFGVLRNLGVTLDDVKYSVGFENGRVEMSFCFLKEPTHVLVKHGVKRGDTIVVAISHRYTKATLRDLLRKQNFKDIKIYFSNDGGTVVVLAKLGSSPNR